MNTKERLVQLTDEFMKQIRKTPAELSVSKYKRWVGPEPVPIVEYRVEYDRNTREVLRRVFGNDQSLGLIAKKLKFRLIDLEQVLVVSLKETGRGGLSE